VDKKKTTREGARQRETIFGTMVPGKPGTKTGKKRTAPSTTLTRKKKKKGRGNYFTPEATFRGKTPPAGGEDTEQKQKGERGGG